MDITLLILLSSSTFTYGLYPPQILRRNAASVVPKAGFYNPLDNGGALLTVSWFFTCFVRQLELIWWTIASERHIPTWPRGTIEYYHLWRFGRSCFGRRTTKWWSTQFFSVCLWNIMLVAYVEWLMTSFIFIFRSFGFSNECLGQHSGAPQEANLGDGNGYGQSLPDVWSVVFFLHLFLTYFVVLSTVNETSEIRWNYGDAQLGACKETIQGGDHFRYWQQNGPQGNRCGFGLLCPWTRKLN